MLRKTPCRIQDAIALCAGRSLLSQPPLYASSRMPFSASSASSARYCSCMHSTRRPCSGCRGVTSKRAVAMAMRSVRNFVFSSNLAIKLTRRATSRTPFRSSSTVLRCGPRLPTLPALGGVMFNMPCGLRSSKSEAAREERNDEGFNATPDGRGGNNTVESAVRDTHNAYSSTSPERNLSKSTALSCGMSPTSNWLHSAWQARGC